LKRIGLKIWRAPHERPAGRQPLRLAGRSWLSPPVAVATVSIETAASIRSKLFVHVHEFMHDLGERRLIGVVEIISGVELCDNYHTLPLWCALPWSGVLAGMASLRPDWFSGSAQ
jgi:hypothetical protein